MNVVQYKGGSGLIYYVYSHHYDAPVIIPEAPNRECWKHARYGEELSLYTGIEDIVSQPTDIVVIDDIATAVKAVSSFPDAHVTFFVYEHLITKEEINSLKRVDDVRLFRMTNPNPLKGAILEPIEGSTIDEAG